MKKICLSFLVMFALSSLPALAASPAPAPSKAWKPSTPEGYTAISWAKAPGIASFFKAPEDNGAIDFLTRIYLPQNQIIFIASSGTPAVLNPTSADPESAKTDISDFPNLSFHRVGAETAKSLASSTKFIWDASFFNMKPQQSDLSMAVKYTIGTTTTISSGSRSVPDMAEARRMLTINNLAGQAAIKDFDSPAFLDKNSDQALEGFSPTVAKSDGAGGGAARLFLGVSTDGRELVIYCSQLATVEEASAALIAAGVPLEKQLETDGGGSAACGYNLPGQFFVEPTRTLPLLMGARTIVARGKVTTKIMNVRSGPSTKFPVVTQLAKDAIVQAYEENNGWYRIGEGQWVLKSLIK